MIATTISDTVFELISQTLNLDRSLLRHDLTVEDLGVDSLDVLRLTFAIETHYRINLSAYNHFDISSIERLLNILELEIERQGVK
jgi:acyl carrier protein